MSFAETAALWLNLGIDGASTAIEFIHENSGSLSGMKEHGWWLTLAISAVSMRLALFPLRWRGWRNSQLIKLTTHHCNTHHGPLLRRTCKRDDFASLMKAKWREICEGIGARPWKSLVGVPFAVPTFLCVAGAVRRKFAAAAGGGVDSLNVGSAACLDTNTASDSATRLDTNTANDTAFLDSNAANPVPSDSATNFNATEVAEAASLLSPFDYWAVGALPVALMNAAYLELQRRKSKTSWPFLIGHAVNAGSMLVLMQMPLAVDWFVAWSTAGAIGEAVFLEKSGWARRRVELQFQKLLASLQQQQQSSKAV